jgi:phosphatidylserine/phosphatidylglycerophosphate/cardiolipin synthase-like enzyme
LVPERDPGAARDDSIQVYFTAPDAGEVIRREAGLDRMLVGAMDQAQRSIDVAIYALNLGDVADALRRADQRGVRVRLVIESDNASEPEVQGLLGAGIAVREDGRPGLMHHKFVVIDSAEVWVGSMNLTLGAAFHDDNNMVRIGSPEVARDFTWEFDEMFEEDRFGALSLADTPKRRLIVGDVPLEVLFSPDDGAAERIEALIDAAEVSLEFAAFSLTSNAIADHILAAAARGVRVRGVMETSQVGGLGSEYERLEAAGLEVRLDGNPFNMHHKFLIIDAETVVTGSYNFTASAEERNDESVMVIHDRAIAESFRGEFGRLLDVANGSP